MSNDEQNGEPSITVSPIPSPDIPNASNIHFCGILSLNTRLQHTGTPTVYRCNPLVTGHHFYTVPLPLIDSILGPHTADAFACDPDALGLEDALSAISGDHSERIGFWNDFAINCNLMRVTPMCRKDLAGMGLSEIQTKAVLKSVNEQLSSFSEIACGYAGWLMTDPTFKSELTTLVAQFQNEIQTWGTSLVGLPIPASQPPGRFNPTSEPGWKQYETAVSEFCIRWRLLGLAGPSVPIPMRPMMSGQFPPTIVPQLMRAGGVFNWPDTFPVFARDELRLLLENALRSASSNEHLAGWHTIVASSNKAKNRIATLERRFRLQHFWRILRKRHPAAFNRRLNLVDRAFASYFGVDESSIRLDRSEIAKSLGKDWDLPDSLIGEA